MKDNIDLRILEKRIKLFKNLTVLFTILTPLPLLGIGLKYPYSYCFVALCGLFFIVAVTFAVLMHKTQHQIKGKNDNTVIKERLVNFAFDTFLKENEDYTVFGRVNGAVLVKKIARWAYCDVDGENIQACFSIETDKGVYCFQSKGQEIMQIDSEICTSIYPILKP